MAPGDGDGVQEGGRPDFFILFDDGDRDQAFPEENLACDNDGPVA